LSDRLFGTGQVASRLPGMVGFWIYCACIFGFVARRAGVCYGLAAMLLPAATQSFRYAFEARSYGLLLGCTGLAMLCWQSAALGERRRWSLPGLALSIAIGVLTHYYIILIFVPLAGAEFYRAIVRHRTDWPLWFAMLAGLTPLAMLAPTALRAITRFAASGSAPSWAPPSVRQYLEYYSVELAPALVPFVVLLALAGLYAASGGRHEHTKVDSQLPTRPHEWTAAALFLSVPFFAITGALVVTHSFTPRYAIVAITGFLILVPLTLHATSRGSATVGLFLLVAAAASFAGQTVAGLRTFRAPIDREPLLRNALERGDVVALTDGLLFLQLWYYAPTDQKHQLVYLADPEAAGARGGWPTLDSELLELRRFQPLGVVNYRSFTSTQKEFLVYFDTDRPAWQLNQILAGGGTLEIVQRTEERTLLSARLGE
jgi:hypothetical protein